MRKLRCIIIGDGDLAYDCAKLLKQYHFEIIAIITEFEPLYTWSNIQGLPVFSSPLEAQQLFFETEYDFLFSIVNKCILSDSIIKTAKEMCVNYHNSPLPRYAGVHATSWAIYNSEKMYGVTWHKLENKIDAGDILVQENFEIDAENETVLSLNVKCNFSALHGFKKLLKNIHRLASLKIPQNLIQRTYYSFNDKVKQNGVISSEMDAIEIDRLVRASSIPAHMNNTFGTAKIFKNDQLYIVTKSKMTKEKSSSEPGSILSTNNAQIKIATKTVNIVLSILSLNVAGKQVLKKNEEDSLNEKVQSPSPKSLITMENISKSSANYERKWVEKISKIEVRNTNLIGHEENDFPGQGWKILHISETPHFSDIATLLKQHFKKDLKTVLLVVVIVYLYKIQNYKEFCVGFQPEKAFSEQFLSDAFISIQPFLVSNNQEKMSIEDFFKKSCNEFESAFEKKHFLSTDIFYRHPGLNKAGLAYDFSFTFSKFDAKEFSHHPYVFCINDGISLFMNRKFPNNNQLIKMENISSQIYELMNSIEHNLKHPVHRLNLLPKYELEEILKYQSASNNIKFLGLGQIFSDVVKTSPSQKAVVLHDITLTYDELDRISSYMASEIVALNIECNDFVLLFLKNQVLMVICVLAVYKANKTYIPSSVDDPNDYIKTVCHEANINIVITEDETFDKAESCLSNTVHLIRVNEAYIKNGLATGPVNTRVCDYKMEFNPHRIVYTIFTSGTTGKPKGVCIPEAAIQRLVYQANYINYDQVDTVAFLSDFAFDAATFEIWGAILNGKKLVCIPKKSLFNTDGLASLLKEERIDVLFLTPSLFENYVQDKPAMFASLKYLVLGGDYISPPLLNQYLSSKCNFPEHIINGYGPTENTTFSSYYEIDKHTTYKGSVPIGRPISATDIYVLDKHHNLCPKNIPGEIYLSGKGLMRGYLNKKELSHSVLKQTTVYPMNLTKLMYRSGDIGYINNENFLEFVMRFDNQVKISGYRVEINTIEATISKYPNVAACKVVSIKINLKQTIIAYIKPAKIQLELADIKVYLKNKLPKHYMPRHFFLISTFPLTKNGKVDVSRLPQPLVDQEIKTGEHLEIGQELVALWKSVLSITDEISIDDDFFEIGGTSLALLKMLQAIKKKYMKIISVRDFFENPTIAQLTILLRFENQHETKDVPPTISSLTERNIFQDMKLIDNINNSSDMRAKPNEKVKKILLTGATGFLGIYLLGKLLLDASLIVYCLIREDSLNKGYEKLRKVASKYSIKLNNNVKVICGDFSLEKLGLPVKCYHELSMSIDMVCHCGTYVNHLYSYEILRKDNVLGTLEMIKFSMNGKLKKLNYISTLAVGSEELTESGFSKEEFLKTSKTPAGYTDGYTLTKWVSEYLLSAVNSRDNFVNVYRLGWIVGSTYTGSIPVESNHLLMLLTTCIKLGFSPAWQARVNILPVDFVSNVIVEDALSECKDNKVINIVNPQPLTWMEIIKWFQEQGYKLKFVQTDKWKKMLNNHKEYLPLSPLLSLYPENSHIDWLISQDSISDAKHNGFSKIISEHKIQKPIDYNTILGVMLKHLVSVGAIPKPTNKISQHEELYEINS